MRVGFAKLEITPADSKYLSGFARLRKANGKLDNLYVKTVIFEVGKEYYGILSYDLVAIDQLIIQSVKQKIKDHNQKGIYFFAATHTHSGPGGGMETRCGLLKPVADIFIQTDEDFIHMISEKSIVAIEMAFNNLKESNLKYAQSIMEGVGHNRNDSTFKGAKNISALFIEQSDKKKAVILNYACHPTVLNDSNVKYSADLPGAIQRVMEHHQYDMSLFLNGSCGDISTRFSKQEATEAELLRYGQLFENKLLSMALHAKDIQIDKVVKKEIQIPLRLKKVLSLDQAQKQFEDCFKEYEAAKAQGVSGSDLRLIKARLEGAEAGQRLAKQPFEEDYLDVNISLIRINNHFFIGVPGELFSELSNQLQSEKVSFIGYMNGYLGYFANEYAYDHHFYEALSSPFERGESEKMIMIIAQAIKTF